MFVETIPNQELTQKKEQKNVISDSFKLARESAKLEKIYLLAKLKFFFRGKLAKETIISPLEIYSNRFRDMRGSLRTWWHKEVSRPELNVDGTKLIQEKIGDPKLNGLDGEYLFQFEVDMDHRQVLYFALSQLKTMVFERRWKKKIANRMAAVSLPDKEMYVLEVRTDNGYQKIEINGSKLLKNIVMVVEDIVSRLSDAKWKPLTDITTDNENLRLGREGILRYQDVNYTNPGSADMILNFVKTGNTASNEENASQLLLDHSQDTLLATNGINTGICHTALVNPDGHITDIQTKVSHALTDGSPAKDEIAAALFQANRQRLSNQNSQDLTKLLHPISLKKTPMIEKERIARARVDVTYMYDFISEHYSTIKNLKPPKTELGRETVLTPELPAYQLFVYALMLTLGKTSCHQLIGNVENDSVIPNIVMLPERLQEAILSESWKNKKPRRNKSLRNLFLHSLGLTAQDRALIKAGGGILPTLAIMAGRLRGVVQTLGDIVTPEISGLTKDQLLVSGLTPGKKESIPYFDSDTSIEPSWFTTAVSSTHTQGAIGIIAQKVMIDGKERIQYSLTLREGKIPVPDKFAKKLKHNLALLIQFIEGVVLEKR